MIEIFAVLFSLISVILTVISNKHCWTVGIIGIIFYAILFYQTALWGNFILQFLFLIQSGIGLYNWSKRDYRQPKFVKKYWKLLISAPIVYLISLAFTLNFESTLPYLDALTTTFSIIAMYLIAKKKIEGWIFWILIDIIYVIMFFNLSLYLSSVIYFIFLILAISGLIKWIKNYEKI